MNEKITLQELADLFARKSQLEQADAEQFVKAFLSLIEEALARDKYVKVKGLGVFKLINVEARKSVDVNTGEAIEIQGHARVSFIPEAGLRDLVNKPFAHFQSVLLKEDVHFEDIPEGETQSEGEGLDLNETDLPEEVDAVRPEPQQDNAAKPEEEIQKKTEVGEHVLPEKTELQVAPSAPEDSEPQKQAPAPAEATEEAPVPPVTAGKESRIPWCLIAFLLLAGILIGGAVTWTLTSGRRYIPEQLVQYLMERESQQSVPSVSQEKEKTDTVKAVPDSARVIQVQKKDTVAAAVPQETARQTSSATPAKRETLADTVEYQITGTQTSYTIRPGESLVRVALKFYGNKKLWPYLVKHNKSIIKNPDNVPVGTTIQIPQLTPKK